MGEDKHQHISKFCDKSFSSGHMRSQHSYSEPLLEEDNPPRNPCSPTTPSPPCKYCGKVFRSLKALYGHMRWHSDKHPLLGFIGGGEGAPQSRKRKRGSPKPRQDFPGHPSSPSDEKLRTEEAAECLLLLSGGHWLEDHHPRADSEATPVSADSEAEEKKKKRLYTCTTCGRTFSSFQALGGHRAYHNKAEKDHPMEELNPSTVMPSKVHGCNVCEKVFPSGQALGGHMRSHFNAHAQPKKEMEKEPCPAQEGDGEGAKKEPNGDAEQGHRHASTGLFDLNLPAMPEF